MINYVNYANKEILDSLLYLESKFPSREKKPLENIKSLVKIFNIENDFSHANRNCLNKKGTLSSLYTLWNELRVLDFEKEIPVLNALDSIKIELGISNEQFDMFIRMIEDPEEDTIYKSEIVVG